MERHILVADIRADTEIRSWASEEMSRICVQLHASTGEVFLGLTEEGARQLLDTVEHQLNLLWPPDTCPDCNGTGSQWVPMAVGSALLTSCHCAPRAN
ncbi:hypothetical protein F0L68_22835 [Solihabitans fulvus]|uniref:Uncharacterized protein n=1 Tax=Solihabitans fulvus TaxID=1892852 RepID=A0A5B2X6F6_9PSEU|nr:hypothetical protein [Solihabitans fulvus]KAA2258679.1 hypothetical protein F0L68_22835 [Solihabitans fulvus]